MLSRCSFAGGLMMLLHQYKRQLQNIAAVVALALLLLWPAYVNGEPFYMTDTSSYLRGADAAAHWLTGHRTIWTDELFQRFPRSGGAVNMNSPRSETPVVLAGRSVYYGILLYMAQFVGNFWAAVVLQALLVATSIAITISVFRHRQNGDVNRAPAAASILVIGALLAAFTPVAYFADFLMPDIFGALGLLAFAHLAFLWKENNRASRAFWFLLLLSAMLFHTANIVLTAVLTAVGALCAVLKVGPAGMKFRAIAAALLLAAAGQALFSWSVKHATGAPPIRPPFVAARIIDDGPGYDYLREHCPQADLIFCRSASFRTRISDSLLWSPDPRLGIFQALSPSEQRLASEQQTRFVLDVLRDRPFPLMKSSLRAVFRQAAHLDLTGFNYTPQNIDYFDHKLPPPFIDHARSSRAFKGTMPVRFAEVATATAVLASLLVIFWVLIDDIRRSRTPSPKHAWVIALLLGVLLNAAVCGALSTPKGRYQMRLIWVLPFAALLIVPRRERVSKAAALADLQAGG